MYFPYLRGRQFELIALREFSAISERNDFVIPIIEPVKKTFNSMKLAIAQFNSNNLTYALILNPEVGDINSVPEITDALESLLTDRTSWIPAFIINNNSTQILQLIRANSYENVMIICNDSTDTSSQEFDNLVLSSSVTYVVSKENRTLKRKLTPHNKKMVRLDDNFNAQRKNSDYLTIPEEKFTEEHLFYSEEGYHGFSDYTPLISEYKEGGAAPFAVCIHLTYQKQNREVWIRHFTSISNDDRANIQGKFAEAANKAMAFLDSENIHTEASDELRQYFSERRYPGLGMSKKISIKHHIELTNSILTRTV